MNGPGSIRLTRAQLEVMHDAASTGYPEEVCGILVGREQDGVGFVVRVVPTRNASGSDRAHRYEIPPADLVHEQRAARASNLRILGFYHSHPDHPAEPSPHDLELAWPDYVYVIVPVAGRRTGQARVWRLAHGRRTFDEVALTVVDEAIRWA